LATWITHLRIAESIIGEFPELSPEPFALGNVAPDSGIPNEDWTAFDPPPSVTHFRPARSGHDQIQDLVFYRKYVAPSSADTSGASVSSFLWGYFFHLITDRYWGTKVALPSMRAFASEFATEAAFLEEAKRDWYGLDFEYLREHAHCLFWTVFLPSSFDQDLLPFLPREALQQNIRYIKDFYRREDEEIERVYINRPNRYLRKQEMDAFVSSAAGLLKQVRAGLLSASISPHTAMSVLEMEAFKGAVLQGPGRTCETGA
jgi:hypothetical protein